MSWTYGQYIWDELMTFINNEYGVAGLMGNFVAESNLIPYRVQGDVGDSTYAKSVKYTNEVSRNVISENSFIHDSKGYSLAQWTYYTRKQNYYNLWKQGKGDFGSKELAVAMVKFELEGGYKSTLNVLKNATDIRTASDYVIFHYEQPADQSTSAQVLRYNNGVSVYDTYGEGKRPEPSPDPPPTPPSPRPPTTARKMPLWFYLSPPF